MYQFKTLDNDRKFIERKFHDPAKPFDPYRRMAYNGYEYDSSTGLSTDEIKKGLEVVAAEYADAPHPVAKARAIEYVLQNVRIDLHECDYFFGIYTWNREIRPTTMDKWNAELNAGPLKTTRERMPLFNKTCSVVIWPDFDHVVPDWDSLLELGFPGILERARKYRQKHAPLSPEQTAFFDGIEIQYNAIIDFIARLCKFTETLRHSKAPFVTQSLKRLHDGPPKTFFDVLQLIYMYFMISESVDCYQVRSLGNGLDSTLRPFFENDLASGEATETELAEYLGYFLMQWSAIGNYWGQPFYMGGSNRDGSCKINRLSYLIIDVYDQLGLANPKIQIKVNHNTPSDFLDKLFDIVRSSRSNFVFCCEPGMMRAMMGYGASEEEARTMDIRGCYETGVRANEVCTSTGYVNSLKTVELVFNDGFDRLTGLQVGLHTGDVAKFANFNDFLDAFLRQWNYQIDSTIAMANDFEQYMSYVSPSSMYSATIVTSLENGRDGYQNGVKFNNSAMLCCSFATTVDALMAVKKLVYDNHAVTITELRQALIDDWEGHGQLRSKALGLKAKYGNGDQEADALAQRLAAFFCAKVNGVRNARGGVYKAIMHSAMQFVWQGRGTGATPDGRRKGDEISKNASPTPGMDRNGVTALINSALKLTPSDFHESFCLDIMLHPTSVQGDDGLAAMKSLLYAYLDGGGMSIQFNVFSINTLKDAQEHPEKYDSLQVRVCGWNVKWNNLPRAEQDAYIRRVAGIAER